MLSECLLRVLFGVPFLKMFSRFSDDLRSQNGINR